jgi:hypothetical protein
MPGEEEEQCEWALIGTFKLNRGVIVVISEATESMLALYKARGLRPYEYETANLGQSNGQQDTESFFQASLNSTLSRLRTFSRDWMSSHLGNYVICYRAADREPAFSLLSVSAIILSPNHCQSYVSNPLVPLLVSCGARVRQMPIPAAVVNTSNFVMSPINPRRNHAAAWYRGTSARAS